MDTSRQEVKASNAISTTSMTSQVNLSEAVSNDDVIEIFQFFNAIYYKRMRELLTATKKLYSKYIWTERKSISSDCTATDHLRLFSVLNNLVSRITLWYDVETTV